MNEYPIEIACIIDDDEMYVSLITKVIDIRKLAKNLIIFRNGEEALDYFVKTFLHKKAQAIPQIILLDLNMPVMDGWKFLEELSKYNFPALKNSTLYIVSSSINPVDIKRSQEFNLVKDFLVKPSGLDDLAAGLKKEVA